jgi:hypothetical protein
MPVRPGLQDSARKTLETPLRIPKGCILPDDGELPFPQFMYWDRERPRWRDGSLETGFWDVWIRAPIHLVV